MEKHEKSFTLLYLLLLLASMNSYAQASKRFLYLVVDIDSKYDRIKESGYYYIYSEANNPNAAFIDSLIDYDPKLKTKQGGSIYALRSDTTHKFLNYFQNISEALQFLDEQGWQLFSINNEVRSIGTDNRVTSDTKYFLRRERND
jgi:hypothetical protein